MSRVIDQYVGVEIDVEEQVDCYYRSRDYDVKLAYFCRLHLKNLVCRVSEARSNIEGAKVIAEHHTGGSHIVSPAILRRYGCLTWSKGCGLYCTNKLAHEPQRDIFSRGVPRFRGVGVML